MSTVDKNIADRIIAGEFPEDNCVRIVKYTNAWGGESYGCEFGQHQRGRYRASEFVINPTVYWDINEIK